MAHDKFRVSTGLMEFLVQSEAQATRTFTEAEIQEGAVMPVEEHVEENEEEKEK